MVAPPGLSQADRTRPTGQPVRTAGPAGRPLRRTYERTSLRAAAL